VGEGDPSGALLELLEGGWRRRAAVPLGVLGHQRARLALRQRFHCAHNLKQKQKE
jgi:hypothetical protein